MMKFTSPSPQAKGFTLIEVLIVLLIMATLAALSSQTIRQSTQVKVKLQKGVDHQSALRNALAIVERDVNLAFHYRDPNIEAQAAIRRKKQERAEQAAAQGQTIEFTEEEQALAAIVPPQLTHFLGEKDKMNFTSLSHGRIYPDIQESDQAEVGYEVRGCKSADSRDGSMQCIFRRISPLIDKDLEEGGESTAILENVTEFQLRYWGEGKDDWVDTWKTNESGDDVTKDHFPQAVEITVATEREGKKLKLVSVAEIRHPNNKKKEPANAPAIR